MRSRVALPILTLVFAVAPATMAAAADRDRDRLPDRWEKRHGFSTSKASGAADPDRDRLRNTQEYRIGTHPRRPDTDGDGLGDRAELFRWHTNPRRADSDRDGFGDGAEVDGGSSPSSAASRPSTGTITTLGPLDPPVPIPPLPIPTPGAPEAAYSYSPASPRTGQQVTFDGRASSCLLAPCSYTWHDVGPDGIGSWALGSGQTIHFTFQNAGTKYVQLTVRDLLGRSDSVTHNVVVRATPTPTPSPTPTPTPTPTPSPSCTRTATPSTLTSQVSAASAGETICLASGNYGTFWGTGNNKPLTLRAANAATPRMVFDLGSGDSNLTLEGFADLSGTTDAAPITNLVFRNNAFSNRAWMRSTAANNGIVFDGNTHIDISPQQGDVAGRVYLDGTSGCGYVVKNSLFQGGASDGVRVGCRGVQILNNRFLEIEDAADAHPDPIQIYGGSAVTIRGNYFENRTSEIAGYIQVSGGSDGLVIESNVFRSGRYTYVANLGIVRNSTFAHNTAEGGTCANNTPCGTLVTDGSSNLVIRDNILGRQPNAASVQNNMLYGGSASGSNFVGTPSFVGPPGEWAGWRLAAGSAGKGRASDSTDVGI
jgi:parallel beta helix pectate lyase-like protein/thrombospondin type 3 repeat protein